jgi:Protein of unknown function (DUF2934)
MSQHHKPMHLADKAHSADSGVLLEDKIRFRAYELCQQRGREEGHATEDWLQAEEEIRQNRGGRKAA